MHEIATAGLRLFAPALIPTCVNCVLEKYYLGVRRKDVSLLLAVCAGAVFTVPGAWLGGMLCGLNGVWSGVLAGQLATTLLLSILVWCKAGRVTLSPRAYSCLDDSFGAETENVLDCAARDADSAMEASRSLHDFCLRHGVRAKEAYMIALCAEEIAINIVRHGFAADRRTHLLELRAIRRNGKFILRFRDDCAHFDPTRYIELHRGDSPIDHIGLRMVMTLVSDAVCINSLGLNTLTLEIPI